jgi:bifunctional non-homologous end joining protein LigD
LVCEVRYREFTHDGLLRHATFARLRDDKRPHECERQGWTAVVVQEEMETSEHVTVATDSGSGEEAKGRIVRERVKVAATALHEPPPPPAKAPVEKKIAFSNLKKIYWPAEKYTKGEMIEYYRAISKWLLPYLDNRPVVLTRFPDGIDGKSFYQKDAPDFVPEWMQTIPIWSEDTQRDIKYFVCDCEEALLYLANMGTIPLHIWASRVGSLELADWCVIDLDPKEAPFSDVIKSAKVLHRICESVGLPNYVKTTGKTGLHIMLPLGRQCTYEQSRMLGELLARLVLIECKDFATITRHVTKRGDKVYLDYLQNRHGQTIVAPFSVRPLPGATVSMPLVWEEVDDGLDPKNFTIKNAMDRMESVGTDPVAAVLDEKPDLAAVLERLAELWAHQ